MLFNMGGRFRNSNRVSNREIITVNICLLSTCSKQVDMGPLSILIDNGFIWERKGWHDVKIDVQTKACISKNSTRVLVDKLLRWWLGR
jgi:hypothetical protein